MSHPDDELRARFDRLRATDHATAPAFQPMWERAVVAARSAPPLRRLLPVGVAAAAAVIVISAGLLLHKTNDSQRRHSTATTISHWTSPTASLLDGPDRGLFAPPPVLSSALDGVIQAPLTLKGESR